MSAPRPSFKHLRPSSSSTVCDSRPIFMSPPSPSTIASSSQATLQSVQALTAFSDLLADFLDQWNSILTDANSIAAALPPAVPVRESTPKPNPAAEPEGFHHQKTVLVCAESIAAAGFVVPDPVAERGPKPGSAVEAEANRAAETENFLHQSNSILVDVTPADAGGFPVADPALECQPKPILLLESESNRVPEPEICQPDPEPDCKPKQSNRDREAGDPAAAALGNICEQMSSRPLRHFVVANLRDHRSWLRRVGPGALRRAPDPAALVLRAVSRYYICVENGDAEAGCLLLLELYVRAGCPRSLEQRHGDAELRAEVREAVLSWRSRIVRDKGRVADANARDARGLILLMAGFGMPVEIPAQELYELFHAGGGVACADVLKCSQLFVKKLRDVVVDMLNREIYHEAIGVILAFDLQDAFPLASILAFIVEKVVHSRKDQESEGQTNLAGSKGPDEQELVLLRSISKYVEDHTPCCLEVFRSIVAERIELLEEHFGKPQEAFKATKRKRTGEDSLDCIA